MDFTPRLELALFSCHFLITCHFSLFPLWQNFPNWSTVLFRTCWGIGVRRIDIDFSRKLAVTSFKSHIFISLPLFHRSIPSFNYFQVYLGISGNFPTGKRTIKPVDHQQVYSMLRWQKTMRLIPSRFVLFVHFSC